MKRLEKVFVFNRKDEAEAERYKVDVNPEHGLRNQWHNSNCKAT